MQPATLAPFPDLMHAAGAFQLTPLPPGVDWRGVVRVSGLYGAGLELPHLVQRVTAEVERHLGRMGTAFPGLQLDELLLDLPCTFFSLKTAGCAAAAACRAAGSACSCLAG